MTHGFQQQDSSSGFCIPKSVAMPQHGQKPTSDKTQPLRPVRTLEPRPGH